MIRAAQFAVVSSLVLLLAATAPATAAEDFGITSIDGEDADQVNRISLTEDEEVTLEISGLDPDRVALYAEIGGERLHMDGETLHGGVYGFETGEHTLTIVQETPDRDDPDDTAKTRVNVVEVGSDSPNRDRGRNDTHIDRDTDGHGDRDGPETKGIPDEFSIATVDGEDADGVNEVTLTEESGIDLTFDGIQDPSDYRLSANVSGERFDLETSGDSATVTKNRPHPLDEGEHVLEVTVSVRGDEETVSTRLNVVDFGEKKVDGERRSGPSWRIENVQPTSIPPESRPSHEVVMELRFPEGGQRSLYVDPFGDEGLPNAIEVTGASADSAWTADASMTGDRIRIDVDTSDGPETGTLVLSIDLDATDVYEEDIERRDGLRYEMSAGSEGSAGMGSIPVLLWMESIPVALEKPNGERVVPDSAGREWSEEHRGTPPYERELGVWAGDGAMSHTSGSSPTEDGVWNIKYDPGDVDVVRAKVPGYAAEPVPLDRIDNGDYSVEDPYVLELSEGAALEVRLENTEGSPLPNGKLEIERTDGPEGTQVTYEPEANDDGVVEARLPEGRYEGIAYSPTSLPGDNQEYDLKKGETETRTLDLKTPGVTSSEVEHVGGTKPDMDAIKVDSIYYEGAILVSVKPRDSAAVSREDVEESGVDADLSDLSGLGVDETTELRLTLEMEHFDPDTLIWAAKDAKWETVERDGDTATVQIETRVTEIQQIRDRHTGFGGAERTDWPTGSGDAADEGYGAVVNFWLFDTSELPSEARSVLRGMSIMTNAQKFGFPEVEDGELSIYMAAPGETADGEEFTGFYQAYLPDSALESWNVDNPKQDLEVMWKGDQERFDVKGADGGVYVEIEPVTFSDGEMKVKSLEYRPPLIERLPYGSEVKRGMDMALRKIMDLF